MLCKSAVSLMPCLLCAFIFPSVKWAYYYLPGKLGLGIKGAVLTCKEPSLVTSSGVHDPGPGILHKSAIFPTHFKSICWALTLKGYTGNLDGQNFLLQEASSLVRGDGQ